MSHKKALEALDRTVRDLRRNARIFGGALILLSGDFRQTLPVISRSTPADELNACLKSSVLWRHLQKLIEATILNGKFKGAEVLLPRIPMIPIYAIRIRTFAVPGATRFRNDYQQSTIVASVWIKFGESMFLTWAALCGLLTRRKTF